MTSGDEGYKDEAAAMILSAGRHTLDQLAELLSQLAAYPSEAQAAKDALAAE